MSLRTLVAFIVGPLAGVVLFLGYAARGKLSELGLGSIWFVYQVALLFSPFYFLLVIISIPALFGIRQLCGWRWWSSILGAVIIWAVTVLLFSAAVGEAIRAEKEGVILTALAATAHGLVFWLIARRPEVSSGGES